MRLAAWKLDRYGRNPKGTVKVYSHGSDRFPAGRTRPAPGDRRPPRHQRDRLPRHAPLPAAAERTPAGRGAGRPVQLSGLSCRSATAAPAATAAMIAAVDASIASLTAFAAQSPSAIRLARLRTSLAGQALVVDDLVGAVDGCSRATSAAVRASGSAPSTSAAVSARRTASSCAESTAGQRVRGNRPRTRPVAALEDAALRPAARRARPRGPCRAGRPGPGRSAPSRRRWRAPARAPGPPGGRGGSARTFADLHTAGLLLDRHGPGEGELDQHRPAQRRRACRRRRRCPSRRRAGAAAGPRRSGG